jgi:uncharacterized cupredoxin-like copper-binding protein
MRAVPIALLALFLAACGGAEEGASGATVEVRLTEYALDPAQVSIDEPGTYTFRAINDGSVEHALEVEGHGVEAETDLIAPGETGEVTVELTETGEYDLYCPVDGHKGQGMDGAVDVGGTGGGGGATTGEQEDDGYG